MKIEYNRPRMPDKEKFKNITAGTVFRSNEYIYIKMTNSIEVKQTGDTLGNIVELNAVNVNTNKFASFLPDDVVYPRHARLVVEEDCSEV